MNFNIAPRFSLFIDLFFYMGKTVRIIFIKSHIIPIKRNLYDYELKFMEIRMLGICVVIVILIFFSIFVTSREFLG